MGYLHGYLHDSAWKYLGPSLLHLRGLSPQNVQLQLQFFSYLVHVMCWRSDYNLSFPCSSLRLNRLDPCNNVLRACRCLLPCACRVRDLLCGSSCSSCAASSTPEAKASERTAKGPEASAKDGSAGSIGLVWTVMRMTTKAGSESLMHTHLY